jgi:hypothetical protein
MKHLLFLISFTLLISACQQSDNSQFTHEEHWIVGDSVALDKRTIDNIDNEQLKFSLDRGSLCPSNGIELIIKNGTNLVLKQKIETMPFETIIEGYTNLEIQTETYIVQNPKGVCITLGHAKCAISY